jgi:hypothetical protein
MKLSIILLLFSTLLTNCESKRVENNRKTRSLLRELYTIYFVGDVYVFRNICPTPRVFEPGTYEISLEKGEALYFDISPRFNPESDNFGSYSYFIGIAKEASSSIAMNELFTCNVNKMFSSPMPIQTASDSSYATDSTDSEFSYYRYSLYKEGNSVLTAKAVKSAMKFKLKIPQKGQR